MESSLRRMSRQRFVLIGILFLHSANTYMDRACISSAAADIMKDLKIAPEVWGVILGIFAIGYALFQVPSGWIADKFGARKTLAIVVSVWSTFTALSGAAVNAGQMLILRFLFGVGEAGAFPGASQAFFRWLPVKERGLAHGINFSGSRLGAALSLFLMPWLIKIIGWRWMFVVNGLIDIVWAAIWLIWFRDNPRDNKHINQEELDYIEKGRTSEFTATIKASFAEIFTSLNMVYAMFQYFASNVTFFITLSWLPNYIKTQWPNDPNAIYYSAIPLIFAAFANWIAGGMVTHLFASGKHVASRRVPAIIGFALGIIGLVLAIATRNLPFLATDHHQLLWFVFSFGLATFGVDMTLSPSWAFCNDIGGGNSGAVSGSMNMVGNVGSALSAILFPILTNKVTGSANAFFWFAAILNLLAIVSWVMMNPNKKTDKPISVRAIKTRFIVMLTTLILLTGAAVGYNFYTVYMKTRIVPETQQVLPQKESVDQQRPRDNAQPAQTGDRQ